MKRDKNIIPLSRDHHFTLLFCWKIRQGLAKNVDLGRIRSYIGHFWKEHMEKHFQEEETLLFGKIPADPLCLRAIQEHQHIKRLIEAIEGSTMGIRENLRELADLVDNHIRFEERELFPFLENTLTKDQLAAIGTQLNQGHPSGAGDSYPDAFWN